jgi:predicted ferric reductase
MRSRSKRIWKGFLSLDEFAQHHLEFPSSTKIIGEAANRAGSVWFCGPEAWGEKLRSALLRDGLRSERSHRERCEFRL